MGMNLSMHRAFGVHVGSEEELLWSSDEFDYDEETWWKETGEYGEPCPFEVCRFGHTDYADVVIAVPGSVTDYWDSQPIKCSDQFSCSYPPENLDRFEQWLSSSEWAKQKPEWWIGGYYG